MKIKQIRCTVITQGTPIWRHKFQAPAQHHFTENDIDTNLWNFATELERRWPLEDFKMIRTGRNTFNFVSQGPRTYTIPPVDSQSTGSDEAPRPAAE